MLSVDCAVGWGAYQAEGENPLEPCSCHSSLVHPDTVLSLPVTRQGRDSEGFNEYKSLNHGALKSKRLTKPWLDLALVPAAWWVHVPTPKALQVDLATS